ncbi:MAG: HIT family protein [Candidatus Woesearchaeota archaeon]
MNCIFCNTDELDIIIEFEKVYAIYDNYPVNTGHMLIIPIRHYTNFFETRPEELEQIYALLKKAKDKLDELYSPDGYNIGINNGKAAGQTIMHLHIHLIPRYDGDVNDPRGGVRHIKEELVPYKG